MSEFQSLIDDHKKIYRILKRLKDVLDSDNKEDIIREIQIFEQILYEVIETHFSAEEEIVLPLLPRKSEDASSPVDCVMNEHIELIKNEGSLKDLLSKYDKEPSSKYYKELVEVSKEVSDMLYNHVHSEDEILFKYASEILSEEDKKTIAKKLALISCESKTK